MESPAFVRPTAANMFSTPSSGDGAGHDVPDQPRADRDGRGSMNASDVQQLLVALLSSGKTSGGRALLITGPWGCGKTYLWKNLVAPQTGRATVYVSAFGATDADDLKSRLLTQFLVRMLDRKGAKSGEKPTLTERAATFFGRPGKAIVAALNSFGGAALQRVRVDPLELADLLDEKTIVCIDDIERTSPTYNVGDLLGIASILAEHKNLDVVLICNEDHIAAGDPERAGPYFRYKEKAVSSEFHLSADMVAMFERVLASSTNSKEAQEFARSEKDTILSVFRRAGVVNLRRLASVFARIEVLSSAGVRALSTKQLRLLCALTLYSADRQLPPREFFAFNEMAFRVIDRMENKPGASKPHAEQLEFVDTYFGEGEYELHDGIYKLVRVGEVEREQFEDVSVTPPELSKGEQRIKAAVAGEWRADLDEEVRELVGDLLDAVSNEPALKTAQMFAGLAYARYLAAILGMELAPAREQAAVDAIRVRARDAGDEFDSIWTLGLPDSLGDTIKNELEIYRTELGSTQRRALAAQITALIDKGDHSGLLEIMAGKRLEPLKALCEDIGLERIIEARTEHPWFFVLIMQGVLEELGQYGAIWPDGLRYREQAHERLKQIANDGSEQRMTRWRARGLLPRGTTA